MTRRGSGVSRRLLLGLALGLGVPWGTTVAQAPAASVPGSELSVYLLTIGQGDEVWEKFGHNAIGIRDRANGTDVVYNWGIFSFGDPGFIARFLRGEMSYWMAPFDAAQSIEMYQQSNRSMTVQELNLSPAQRATLRDFVLWNAREENKFYRYDYFRDNCSTRVRDVLDRVLGGILRASTEPVVTAQSYRDHALRLMAEDRLTTLGIDIGLGRPSDRPISAWEEMFIPMKVRDHVRELRVPDDSGRMVPLVTAEREIFTARRAAERQEPPLTWPVYLGLGLVLAALAWRVGRRVGVAADGRIPAVFVAIAMAWGTIIGILGLALLGLRWLTVHEAAYDNSNLVVYNPLWLLLGVLLPFVSKRPAVARGAMLAARVALLLAVLGTLAFALPWIRQHSLAVVALVLPMHVVVAASLYPALLDLGRERPAA